MFIHYWTDSREVELRRAATPPEFHPAFHGWHTVSPDRAAQIAAKLDGWIVMPIHEIDYHALLGTGWKRFTFDPTEAQRERCRINHGGRSLEDMAAKEGMRWEEIVAVLTDQSWRRLIPMRAFTTARDWPLSVPK